jgi:hypothetical protein
MFGSGMKALVRMLCKSEHEAKVEDADNTTATSVMSYGNGVDKICWLTALRL